MKVIDEESWLTARSPGPMLAYLISSAFSRRSTGDRKPRLFALACYHRVWGVGPCEPIRNLFAVAGKFADGLCGQQERVSACNGLLPLLRERVNAPERLAAVAASHLGARSGWQSAH